jgi:hypothetical protein
MTRMGADDAQASKQESSYEPDWAYANRTLKSRTRDPITKTEFVGAAIAFGLFNVILMFAYAMSLLGPVPFDLIWTFLGISALGTVASLFIRGKEIHWPVRIAISTLFGALAGFNWWMLLLASAAV